MTTSHQFGGSWTDEKLQRLRKYLDAYIKIFSKNERARYYETTFVDAFAGTGYRDITKEDKSSTLPTLLDGKPIYDEEGVLFQKGSAQIALETRPPFGRYLFIEKNPDYIQELETLRDRFPSVSHRIQIIQGDANVVIKDWCQSTDWSCNRAVVFLDPYGMEVEWDTIEAIAQTRAIDLLLLFPLGQGVNRILTRSGPPQGGWADRLTAFFGTTEWKDAFYRPSQQLSLFGEDPELRKEASFEQIATFFNQRLATVFERVAVNPLYLHNSKNVPIYLLCFAAANPIGAPTAVNIAQHILRP